MNEIKMTIYSKKLYNKFVTGDYRKKFINEVNKLLRRAVDAESRNRIAENLCIAYIDATGERPPKKGLNTLTVWLLQDDLKDRNKWKVSNNDYPILTRRQINRRKYNEFYFGSKWKDVERLRKEIERELMYAAQLKPSSIVTYNIYDLTEEELKEKGLWKYVKDKFEAEVKV